VADGADPVEVEAIGCSGTGGWLLVSREGEPLTPVLASVPDIPGEGWIASARDFVASLLTGRLATDPTVASATGFFAPDGSAADPRADRMAPQNGSTDVLGDLMLPAARRLGLRSRIPVAMGATSEVCAVEGAGAVAPLVTFGSPLVVHVPVSPPAAEPPPGVVLRAGGRSYQVYEAPLPGMVDALEGLVLRTGRTRESLAASAAVARPGEDPVRVAYESGAYAVLRVVRELAPEAPFLYAHGAPDRAWRAVLPSVTGLPVVHRRSPELTTLGLAMLTATATGGHLDREETNPVAYVDEPDLDLAGRYAADAR
jgi:sugar (pentulose or hexulose) kinase